MTIDIDFLVNSHNASLFFIRPGSCFESNLFIGNIGGNVCEECTRDGPNHKNH